MDRRVLWIVGAVALIGCAGVEAEVPTGPGEPGEPHEPGEPGVEGLAPTPGPIAQAPVVEVPGVEERFSVTTLSEGAASPVTAVTPELTLLYAYVDLETDWPVVGRVGGGDAVPLPGDPGATASVAMVASADGTAHLLWDAGGVVRHVRWHPDGRFDEPQVLSEEGARDPNAAVGPDGELAVAWTRDLPLDAEGERQPAIIEATRGVLAAGALSFEPTRLASEGCCRAEFGGPSNATSGPSVAVAPNGDMHLVWEWSTFSNTTIEHRSEADGFATSVVISDVAFSPCPALVVDEDGAHISYLVENWDNRVLYKRVLGGEIVEERALYSPDGAFPRLALMKRDEANVLHLGVVERVGGSDRLVYVRVEEGETAHVISEVERPAQIHLTPRAGGAIIAPDGKMLLAYQRAMADGPSFGEFAMGR